MPGGYLLDTNVISETRRSRADPGVIAFLSAVPAESLYLSVLSLGELRKGVEAKRRHDPVAAGPLERWVEDIATMFADRVIPVDTAVARLWGLLSAGRTLPVVDTLIAATAIDRGLTLLTRNIRDVEPTGVATHNPWRDLGEGIAPPFESVLPSASDGSLRGSKGNTE